jgi:hypothetical protein
MYILTYLGRLFCIMTLLWRYLNSVSVSENARERKLNHISAWRFGLLYRFTSIPGQYYISDPLLQINATRDFPAAAHGVWQRM